MTGWPVLETTHGHSLQPPNVDNPISCEASRAGGVKVTYFPKIRGLQEVKDDRCSATPSLTELVAFRPS